MREKWLKIFILGFIAVVAVFVIRNIAYLSWTSYQKVSICSDFQQGNSQAIKELILKGKVSVEYSCSFPLLALSTQQGDTAMIKFLLENGAKTERQFVYSRPKTAPYRIYHTPLFYAVYAKFRAKKLNLPLEINASFVEGLKLLLKYGANLDTPCGRIYQGTVSDSLKNAYRASSPDQQTAREVIKLINDDLLNELINVN